MIIDDLDGTKPREICDVRRDLADDENFEKSRSPIKLVKDFILKRHVPHQRWAFDDNDIETISDVTRIESRPVSELDTIRPAIARTEKKTSSITDGMTYKVNVVKVRHSRDPRVDLLLHSSTRQTFNSLTTKFYRCAACHQDFAELDEIRKPHGCEHLFHSKCLLVTLSPNSSCPDISHHS